jgi:DNA-binding XRE family transcriptional regulator
MTPECTAAWRNYECKVNVTGYERRTQDAFVAGWQAATDAAVNTTALALEAAITSVNTAHNVLTPAVGHVCVGPPSSRKPGLCWICGQFLPHDCVGGAQPVADRLDGFALLPDAQDTHGPPLEVDTIAAELIEQKKELAAALFSEPANRLTPPITPPIAPTGRKWPIGTPDETVYGSAYSTADEWHLRLRAARINCGLTLDALARRLDPPRTRKDISAMEHGRRGLSVELCAQLADALDCDRLWLAGWTL